jgi:hypothetical protein
MSTTGRKSAPAQPLRPTSADKAATSTGIDAGKRRGVTVMPEKYDVACFIIFSP